MQNNLESNYANYANRWMSASHVVVRKVIFHTGINSSAGAVGLVFSGGFGERLWYEKVW